jgi:hypothetical protein
MTIHTTNDRCQIVFQKVRATFAVSWDLHSFILNRFWRIAVPVDKDTALSGMYVLKYAHCVLNSNLHAATTEDVNDNFQSIVRDNDLFAFGQEDIEKMRLNCIDFLLRLTVKFRTVRAPTPPYLQHIEKDIAVPGPKVYTVDQDDHYDFVSEEDDFGDACQTDEDEDSDHSSICDDESYTTDGLNENAYFGTTESELPIDYDVGKMLSVGDEIMYRPTADVCYGRIRRATIRTIDTQSQKSPRVVLQNGEVLDPVEHMVCRTKMCITSMDQTLTNPSQGWFQLKQFYLQPGSISIGLPGVGRGRKRIRASEGITRPTQKEYLKGNRKHIQFMRSIMAYPTFPWTADGSKEYYDAIDTINRCYRQMLDIGSPDKFKPEIASASDLAKFRKARKSMQHSYNQSKRLKLGLRVPTEYVPDPRNHVNDPARCLQTQRERITKEEILKFEHEMKSLNIRTCKHCLENKIVRRLYVHSNSTDYICPQCKDRNDPNYFLNNNLHPIWYAKDSDGNDVLDRKGNRIPQFSIPRELKDLTYAEQLLIRRYAPIIPSIHLSNGVYGSKGHCVAFPQDITGVCDELPRRKEAVVTVIRYIGNKDTSAVYPTLLKVNRNRVILALKWLKRHNPLYKNIRISEGNLGWMNGKAEANIASEAEVLHMKKMSTRTKILEEEEEYVSPAHKETVEASKYGLPMETMHANETDSVPSGNEAQMVKELIGVARESGQMKKMMDFPPIDHDSPIS